jgi:cobalt transporter subunit CbtB
MEGCSAMTGTTLASEGTAQITIPWWSWFVLVAALLGSYLMLQENGVLLAQWETLHELFHDGRHGLGFPCH